MDAKFYCCYSLNLRKYLQDNDMKYIMCALNLNSKKMFWVFIKNDKLQKLLDNWVHKNNV
mgnify:CR=1 FL=1